MFRRHIVLLVALFCPLTTANVGRAIDIVLVYDNLDENPSFDRRGTQLMAVASAAAQIWEQLIPSSGTHTVDVSWSDLDEGQLGLWKYDPFGNNNIYFDSNSSWFIDPTPLDHGEYDFGDPFVYSSGKGSFLTGTTSGIGDWFDGPPLPSTLEIGYLGLPTSTAPSAAKNNFDLLSVILHELGHDLGVGGDELSGRYPIDPAHLSEIENIEVVEGNFDDPDSEGFGEEHGHLAPPMALMSPSTPPGLRTLPSAVDVLVAARDSNYLSVDLVRKFVGVGTNWNSARTWIGGRVPDSTDDAYVVHGGTVTLSANGRTENLYIGRSSTVGTGAHSLTVDNLLAMGDSGGVLRINSGGSATVGTIQSPDESVIEMSGGTLNVLDGGSIRGELKGHGTVNFGGQVVVSGQVNADGGTLELTGGGSILLLQTQDPVTGQMRANDGDLKLDLGFDSSSSGSISVGAGRRLIIARDLTIPNSVQVSLGGLLTSEGAVTDVTIGHLTVGYESTGQVLSRTVTLDGNVFVDTGGHLTLASPIGTTLQGSMIVGGNGTLKQDGDISVTGGTVTLDVTTLDWGNSTPTKSNDLRLHPNSTLRVTGYVVGTYRGELTVDSAILQVDTPGGWQLGDETATTAGGSLALIQSGATTPTVRGTPLTARHWIITSGGDAFIESDLTVMSTAQVLVFGGSKLFLLGHTTLRGGSITGLGDLVQRGDFDVTSDTTIATDTFAWGNSLGLDFNTLTVQRGATLTVDSPNTGNADNRYRGAIQLNGGTLVVNTDSGWLLPASQLFQVGGGLEMTSSANLARVQGQALTVGGGVYVMAGAAHIDSDVVFQSTHESDIAAGATLHLNGAASFLGGQFTGKGTLQHNGSALLTSSNPLIAPHFIQNGLITTANPNNLAAIQAATIQFQPGSRTKLFTNLRLRGAAELKSGAVFEGNGTLVVEATGSLSGGENLGVDLENQGLLRPGFSLGRLNVAGDYKQGPLATLQIELAGKTAGRYDVLAVSGTASLDGILDVSLLGGFTPALGDSFTILTAGTRGGTFDEVLGAPSASLPGLFWTVEYTSTAVILTTSASPSDLNLDGHIDRVDLALFRIERGTASLVDLARLQRNFDSSPPPLAPGDSPGANAVPEPTTWGLAVSALGMLVAVRLSMARRSIILNEFERPVDRIQDS